MRRFHKATIKDVARQAGVSTTTVSVFVSGRAGVCSPETAQRIRAAIEHLNYTPSSLTGALRRRATRTVGVCMLSPLDPRVQYGGPFFERLWRGIAAEADQEDYSLLQYPASVREGESCDPFLDGRVDGMLFHAHGDARPARIAAAGMPIVLLTRSVDLPEECGAVYANENDTADLALSHLWALGHRRIAHVAGPTGHAEPHPAEAGSVRADDPAIRRLEAYGDWMGRHGAYDPALIACAGTWREWQDAAEVVARWRGLPDPPTAVFCANDALALAVIAAARQGGWRVPEDLSVVGVDDSAEARRADPALTSIEIPVAEIGREAMRALLRLLRGAPRDACRLALPVTQLTVRASTGRRSGAATAL